MSASEHTPGPWNVDPKYPLCVRPGTTVNVVITDLLYDYGQREREQDRVAIAGTSSAQTFYRSYDEAKANARLIAAAPDLLEAAAYLLDHADNDPDNGHSAETYNEAWEMLEKAVAKAEGENV